ncbi:MAG: adenine deaminase [Sulfolobales archaeon]
MAEYKKDIPWSPHFEKYRKELLKDLIYVAKGLYKANIIVRNTTLFSVSTGELIDNSSIVIFNKFIARVLVSKDPSKYLGDDTLVIDGKDLIAVPGFIDAHVHIESSYVSPIEFSKIAVLHGTTTVVADPHEVANVGGVEALNQFIEMSKKSFIKILLQVPSCVPPLDPSIPIDSPGTIFDNNILRELIDQEDFHSLGEYMDYLSVVEGSDKALEIVADTILKRKKVYGHIPSLDDEFLDRYILTGVSSCHESTSSIEALEKLRRGLYLMIRQGSSWKDLNILEDLLKKKVKLDRVMLVSDDINIIDLYERGYMDNIVREAIELGIDPLEAIRLVTIIPATYIQADDIVGVIAPGRFADIVLLKDLSKVIIDTVISNGRIFVYKGESMLSNYLSSNHEEFMCYIKCRRFGKALKNIGPEDFLIKVNYRSGSAKVRVIKLVIGKTITLSDQEILEIKDGFLTIDPSKDLVYAAVIDRYNEKRVIGRGFIKGLGLLEGALAQTIAHDTHNILVVGKDPLSMISAVNRLIEIGGGIVIALGNKILSELVLEGYGLFSTRPYIKVYEELKHLEKTLRELGVAGERVFMTLSLVPLPVIPSLRLTPKGLVDVENMKLIDPVIEYL